MPNPIIHILYTLIVSTIGGLAFHWLDLPLPWMLGPMIFSIFFTIVLKEGHLPAAGRNVGYFIFGTAMGMYFTPAMGSVIADMFIYILVMSLLSFAFGLMNSVLFKKMFNLDWMTAIFGSMPGGTAQMIEVGGDLGGNRGIIAIQQMIRVILVVMIIPSILIFTSDQQHPIASSEQIHTVVNYTGLIWMLMLATVGLLIAKRIRIPMPYLNGPLLIVMIASLFGFPSAEMPALLLNIAQLIIGTFIGISIKKKDIMESGKYVRLGCVSGITLIVMSFGAAYLLHIWANVDFPTAALSTSPGGVAEMSITAVVIGANVPLVVAYQVIRMTISLIVVPYIMIKLIGRKNRIVS